MIEFNTLDEWVGHETMLLGHTHSIITCLSTPSVVRTSPLRLGGLVDNEPDTDSSEEPFSDEEDGVAAV